MKNYPPDFWLELFVRSGHENTLQDLKKTIILGPAEENVFSFFMENRLTSRMEINFCPDKETLTRLLGESALYLGHDSGITHLAAMLGAPVIALFRTSDARQWRPLGPRVKVIDSQETGRKQLETILDVSRSLITNQS